MQEQEERQREIRQRLEKDRLERERQRSMRERLAEAQISNAQGLQDRDALFGPVPDYEEKRRPITRLFFSVYDNLGTLMAINIFTFVLTLPFLVVLWTMLRSPRDVVVLLPLLLLFGIIAAPSWGAASSYCAKTVEGEMHTLRDYWSEYRRLFGKSLLLALGQFVISGALLYAMGWYIGQGAGPLKIVGIICLYLFIFWNLIGLYLWPLMVRGYRWRAILRNGLVLVAAAPVRAVGIMIVLVILSIILLITGIGAVLLLFGLWAMLPNQALVLTRERMEKRAAARR